MAWGAWFTHCTEREGIIQMAGHKPGLPGGSLAQTSTRPYRHRPWGASRVVNLAEL